MNSSSSLPSGPLLSLKEAVEKSKAHTRVGNSYEWYRGHANRYGRVSIGGRFIAAFKIGSRWMVSERELNEVIVNVETEKRTREDATAAYSTQRLLTAAGTIETTWGSYTVRGPFHRKTTRKPSSPWATDTWYCNKCFRPAQEEHDREECHRCRDWSPCNRNCTLSAVKCDDCGTRLAV